MGEDQPITVEIKADHGTESLGRNAYFAAMEGQFDSKGFRSSLIVMFGLMAVIVLVMVWTRKSVTVQKTGKELPIPQVNHDDLTLSPKLLTERDLVNVIRRGRGESSAMGKIRVLNLRSLSEIPVGSEIKAVLESGATDGIVKARLTSPLFVEGEPILPENAIIFGRGRSGDERLFVEFTKVIFPSGESFAILAQAFDVGDKILGLKGAIVGTRTKKMAAAMAFGFLGGMADGLQDTSGSVFLSSKRPTVRDAALSGTSKAALDQSKAYIEEMKNSPNIIEVKSGTGLVVIVDEPKTQEDRFESK